VQLIFNVYKYPVIKRHEPGAILTHVDTGIFWLVVSSLEDGYWGC
jgi:hypothetical protein